jgi:hypothetical protein
MEKTPMSLEQLRRRMIVLGMVLWGWTAGLAAAQSEQDDAPEASGPGRLLPAREFTPAQVPQALAETDARHKAFYEALVEKGHYKGTLTILGSALGRYGLNRDLQKANQLIVLKYEKAYALEMERDGKLHHPWYNFGKEQRLVFLFGSRSKFFPGRMSLAAEKVLLEKMWAWAQATTRLEMTLPERDWWMLGSENHWAHLWTGMWGAAQIFADHPDYRDQRYADGTDTAAMAKAFDERFKRFARDRACKGLLMELNSAYNKQTLSGLYNVADFATDPVLKNRMRMFFDVYWADWAIEQIDGFRGGSRSRSYPGPHSTTGSSVSINAWYHFGVGEPLNHQPDVWAAATTLYRPDPLVVELAMDVQGRGNYANVSRRMGLRDMAVAGQKASIDAAVDGPAAHFASDPHNILYPEPSTAIDPRGGGLLRYTWCTPDFILGTSMVEARPNADWANFSSQNRWDGAIFGGHSTARIYVQSQGAKTRSFYNANWSVQCKGVLVVQRLKDGLSSEAKGQRVWFDQSLERVEKDGWVFAQGPRAYAAVRVVEGGTEWKPDAPAQKDDKPGPGMFLYCAEELSPVIIEAAQKSDYASFSAFQQAVLANPLSWKAKRLDYRSNLYQTQLTLFADYSQPPRVDGVSVNYSPAKVYDSPFLQGDFGKGLVTLKKGDRQAVLDFTKEDAKDRPGP